MRVVLYPRVSSSTQAKQGDSVEAQEMRLTNYCKDKDLEIVGVYTDAGKSASYQDDQIVIKKQGNNLVAEFDLKKRPAFMRLIQEAKDKKFEGIVFYKWDRWSRDIAFADLTARFFKNAGVELIPTDDSNNPFISSIMQAVNKQETDKMKNRVREVRLYRFEQGMMVGRSPFGYEPISKNKKIVGFRPHPKQAEVVRKVFEYTLSGKDYKEICSELKIAPQQYYNIIRNPVYAGFIEFEGKIKKGVHEAIVGEETFQKVQEKMKK